MNSKLVQHNITTQIHTFRGEARRGPLTEKGQQKMEEDGREREGGRETAGVWGGERLGGRERCGRGRGRERERGREI